MIKFLGLNFEVSYKSNDIFIRNKLVNFQITNFPILSEKVIYISLDNTYIDCINIDCINTNKLQKRFIKNEKFALDTLEGNLEFIVKTILDKKGNLNIINLKTNQINKKIKKLQTKSGSSAEQKLKNKIHYHQNQINKLKEQINYINKQSVNEQMKKDSSEKIEKLKKSKAFKDRDKLKDNYKELYSIVEKYNIWI